MDEQYVHVLEKIDWVEKLCNQTLNHVTHSIDLFWVIIGVVFLVIGGAAVMIAKQMAQTGVDKGLAKAEDNRKVELQELERKINLIIVQNTDILTTKINQGLEAKADKYNLFGAWLDLVLVNGYQSISENSVQFAKNGDTLFLRGIINHSSGTVPLNVKIATLPTDYSPLQTECRIVPTLKGGYAKLEVSKNGELQLTYSDNTVLLNAGVEISCNFKI